MRSIVFLFFLLSAGLFCSGCSCPDADFIGLSRSQIAARLEKGPKLKDGSFRVLYSLPGHPASTLTNHLHKDKESLLNSSSAMLAPQWLCFFHEDVGVWHSYLLTFEGGRVVSQEERRQPHWVYAEP